MFTFTGRTAPVFFVRRSLGRWHFENIITIEALVLPVRRSVGTSVAFFCIVFLHRRYLSIGLLYHIIYLSYFTFIISAGYSGSSIILVKCVKTADFDYTLPPELIAQTPVEPRDRSRLMVLDRKDDSIVHRRFFEITDYLHEGDMLVFNDSRVIPARLKGRRAGSGGKVEILLLRRERAGLWEALVKPARRLQVGSTVEISVDSSSNSLKDKILTAAITGVGEGGIRRVRLSDEALLLKAGEVPLPPYIHAPLADPDRYQTVYASVDGSAAAPTAGLHFTHELMREIASKGIKFLFVTLHVGLDTFRPVTEDDPREHVIYKEYGIVSREVAAALSEAKRNKQRILAVGTTTVRILEQAALTGKSAKPIPFEDWVNLFILPGHRFRMVDAMVTNFHLPRSTLLMLVSAFGGQEFINKAYQEAISEKYRFYSFGDAMLIL
jgi:S-adenosylmethionine:tRNA ribosyltransferase-isomerase